ncbi:hypothetical protein ACS5PN_30875 [Roseateles sp. NT4]|uniref:hypothetical protein n=1 Tax=Roseateles sp. NT4 TaxID=3453715 RepID=UPI003EE89FFC
MALFEFNRSFGPVPGVGQLTFERAPGLIYARDGDGRLVMRIATGPGFGQRLATAFYDYRKTMQEASYQNLAFASAEFPPKSASDDPTECRRPLQRSASQTT